MAPRRAPLALASALALGGCIEDLDPKNVVRSPRILDIVASRPEVNPGEATSLSVVLAGARGPATYRWYACVSPDATRPGMTLANFGENSTFDGCFGDDARTAPLGTNPTATFRAPANMLDNLEALASRFGAALPPGALRTLARDIGLTVGVGVEVRVDGATLLGYKRVVISLNPRPHANPPPPRVRVHQTWVSAAGREDGQCAPEDGADAVRVPRGLQLDLAPDPEERWVETYRVLTASGQVQERTETAFYSWYVTDGGLARGLTRSPTRNNIWSTPPTPGPQTLWVLLRDGHGGTSACRVPVTVE